MELILKYIILIVILLPTVLFAHTDNKVFLEYYHEQSLNNFLKAVTFYGTQSEISNDATSQAYYLNTVYIEMQNSLNRVLEHIDSLSVIDKFQTANILLDLGHFEHAITIYDMLLEIMPGWTCALRHKGEAYLKIKDYENAEKLIIKAIASDPDHYDAYLMLADAYLQQRKYQLAYDIMQDAFKMKGEDISDSEAIYSLEEIQTMYLDILKALNKKKEIIQWEKRMKTE